MMLAVKVWDVWRLFRQTIDCSTILRYFGIFYAKVNTQHHRPTENKNLMTMKMQTPSQTLIQLPNKMIYSVWTVRFFLIIPLVITWHINVSKIYKTYRMLCERKMFYIFRIKRRRKNIAVECFSYMVLSTLTKFKGQSLFLCHNACMRKVLWLLPAIKRMKKKRWKTFPIRLSFPRYSLIYVCIYAQSMTQCLNK